MIRLRPSGVDELLIKRVRDWYEPGPGVFFTGVTGTASFSPAMLFTTGVNGVWYDPSDYTTLFRDAAGTQPVTAVEQPVGLMLDKSKGLVLGSELVTNGDFSNGTTGWTNDYCIVTVANEQAILENNSANNYATLNRSFSTTNGKWYYAEVSYISGTSSVGGKIQIGTTPRGGDLGTGSFVAAGNKSFIRFLAVGSTTYVTVVGSNIAGQTATFDNISVRELPGNHAFNPSGNSANFPVLSARYNLLTKTEDFSNATAWPPTDTIPTADAIAAPNGTVTADLLTQGAAGTANIKQVVTVPSGVSATASVYLKRGNTDWVRVLVLDETGGTNSFRVWVNLATGQKGSANISGSGVLVSADVVPAGNDWYRVILTGSNPNTTSYALYLVAVTGDNTSTRQSSGTYHPWGASLTVANDGVNIPYQRVNTATDYDTVGFKPYLSFNGTNQWLQTNSIDFTYGDKMFVSAGVRKLSDVAVAPLVTFSTGASNIAGAFSLEMPGGAGLPIYSISFKGSAFTYVNVSTFTAPITNVVQTSIDIAQTGATNEAKFRVNGISPTIYSSSGTDAGTGNFGNYPLYIGARGGSSLWFNGRLYGLVVAGKQASASEIASTETFINQKTGAF